VSQHTTQLLLPDVVKRIDSIEHENFSIPTPTNQRWKEMLEADAVPAETHSTIYDASHFTLRQTLTNEQHQRLDSINALFKHALNGGVVSIQKLRRVLSADELKHYEQMFTEIVEYAEVMYGNGMPEALRDYNAYLQQADFQYNKYEKMSGLKSVGSARFKSDSITKTYNKSEVGYERALEYLHEQIGLATRDGSLDELLRWLDREVDFGPNGTLGINADQVPRVKGSRSRYAQDAGLPKLSKRLKQQSAALRILLVAAVDMAFDVPKQAAVKEQDMKRVVQKLEIKKIQDLNKQLHPEGD
jgi:hypothetical protein